MRTHICTALLVSLISTTAMVARAADPTTADCLSANERSISLRTQHQFRAARSELLVCAAASCPSDIRVECARRVGEVNAAMPTIVFEAKDAEGNDITLVKVTMDGQPLVERLEGTALSIDPGEHVFVFQMTDKPLVQRTFVIREGEKERRERITFAPSAIPAPSSAPPVVTAPPPTAALPPVGTDRSTDGNVQRIVGWSAAGLGAVGVILGGVFEAQRSSKLGDADAVCPAGVGCPAGSQARIDSLTDDAQGASTRALVSFIAGGVLVTGGLIAVFTAPKQANVARLTITPVALPQFQGIMVNGHVW